MSIFPKRLEDWGISKEFGFILENPLQELPDYYKSWNDISSHIPLLIKTREFRRVVHKMPQLDLSRLSSYKECRLAHTQLCFMASGYVWQNGASSADVPKVLPRQIAVPLWELSKQLNVNAGMNHASFMECNWKLKDPERPFIAENIETICKIPGEDQFDWFIGVSLEGQKMLSPGLQAIPAIFDAVQYEEDDVLVENMNTIAHSIRDSTMKIAKMHDVLDQRILYEIIRPFIFGWGGKGTPLPDGLIYEGVSDIPIKSFAGGTSIVLDPFDALVGTKRGTFSENFVQSERTQYTNDQKRFTSEIEKHTTLRQYVSNSHKDEVKLAFDSIVAALLAFRQYHMDIVRKYVHHAAEKANASTKYEYTQHYGSGANELFPVLKHLINDTAKSFV